MEAACDHMGRRPAVCHVGASEDEARSRGAFAFEEVLWYNALTYWCLFKCQALLVYFLVVTEPWGCCRVGHM